MISACIVGQNNAPYIRNCLHSMEGLADEILYLDTGSTDGTIDIVKEYTDRIFHIPATPREHHTWKNFLIEKATQDWIFSIDSDEVATEWVRKNIRYILRPLPITICGIRLKLVELINDFQHFLIPPIKYPFFGFMPHPRIFRKKGSQWEGSLHERYVGTGEIVSLDVYGIVHYNLLMLERLRQKTHPQYRDKQLYSDNFIVELWQKCWDQEITELPKSITWREAVKFGRDFK